MEERKKKIRRNKKLFTFLKTLRHREARKIEKTKEKREGERKRKIKEDLRSER